MTEPQDFNVKSVELQSSKLIEASAGTGKTYSVAILVLRLILEKQIPIEKILMVTFTKAAVAELESRIRRFVRLAYRFASGKEIHDQTIKEVVGVPDEDKISVLRNAVQSLDSLSVMTIHSFCQKTIDEFTFETDQSFDYEIVQDDSFLREESVLDFRREVVNTIADYEWFKKVNSYLKFDKISDILKKYLEGKTFLDIDLTQNQNLSETTSQSIEAYRILKEQVILNFKRIQTTRVHGSSKVAKSRENPEQFLPVFIQSCCVEKKYTTEFAFLYEPYGRNYAELYLTAEYTFYTTFISSSREKIDQIKQSKGFISYDDQIKTIHKALANESFKEKLSGKYQAVFIDEFQDTDKHQYEIFNSVFSGNSTVFYIGDPKQSIYGWRSADLDTYKLAKRNVAGSVFSMNKNYRSTKEMIEALNLLLHPGDNYNLFEDDEIRYINVGQGAVDLGEMSDQGHEVAPITIWEFEEEDETNCSTVAREIYRLLTDDVKIKERRITPSDIGVLVRGNKEGDAIKKALARFNIPSVKRDDAKVLNSEECGMIKYLLIAVISPNRGAINRVLINIYQGFTTQDLNTLDDQRQIEIFIELRKILTDEGVYNMISSFLDIYGIRINCMKDVLGQRVLTNINQLAEILHKIEKQFKYTPDELLVWMERSSGEDDEEFEQRVESDEEAVQISTIHKAKGLEYNIVFAPSLSMTPIKHFLKRGNLNEFKKDDKYWFTLNYPDLGADDQRIFDLQKEQENRRLIYVTLTRAVYKSYISLVPKSYKGHAVPSSLSAILDHYQESSALIEVKKITNNDLKIVKGQYQPQTVNPIFSPKEEPKLEIINTFGIHSFSGLSKTHHSVPFEKGVSGETEAYDQFIFQDLARGADAGTALHSIFEHLNFAAPDSWDQTLKEASKYYSNIIKEESLDLFKQLVTQVMNAELDCNGEKFSLSRISNDQKLSELEFCFSMNKANKIAINELLGVEADLEGDADIEGLMAGFIDLFFEYNGKYYILDWKSNYLGNKPEDYGQGGLIEAMKGNNYNLQYFIYTVAMKRYLEIKMPGFNYDEHFGGVIYIFLRGVRDKDNRTGIYYTRPTSENINRLEEVFYRPVKS